MKIDYEKLAISILIPIFVGALSAFLTMTDIRESYLTLALPDFAPPGWIFGPVWTILYILMGIASYLVWTSDAPQKQKNTALWLYSVQLALNFLWTIIFFGFQTRGAALIEIIVLLVFIIITTVQFYRISKPAAYLMIPYLLWVTFATYLNYAIWQLNIK